MSGIDESLAFVPLNIAVLTISDTRSLADDKSGNTLVERLERSTAWPTCTSGASSRTKRSTSWSEGRSPPEVRVESSLVEVRRIAP